MAGYTSEPNQQLPVNVESIPKEKEEKEKDKVANYPTGVDRNQEPEKTTVTKNPLNVEAEIFVPGKEGKSDVSVLKVGTAELLPAYLVEIPVEVHGFGSRFQGLFDSGADNIFVKEKVIKQLEIDMNGNQQMTVRGMGVKNFHKGLGTVELELVILGNKMERVQFHVVGDNVIQNDFVLGRKFMGKNRLVKQPNGDIIQRWGDGKEKWIVHCDNGRVSGVQNSLPCRSAEDRKFKSGEVLNIKIENLEYGVNGIIPGIGDQDLEIFYDGDIVEKRYNKYLEGLPGFLPLGFKEIMVKVDKGTTKGKIKKGDILGYIIFSTECESREDPKEIIEPGKEEWR